MVGLLTIRLLLRHQVITHTPFSQLSSYVSILINLVIIIILKIIQIVKFDIIKTLYNMSNLKANFNMTNYVLQNLFFCAFVNNHFIFYQQIFKTTTPICLGVKSSYIYGSTYTYFNSPSTVIYLLL